MAKRQRALLRPPLLFKCMKTFYAVFTFSESKKKDASLFEYITNPSLHVTSATICDTSDQAWCFTDPCGKDRRAVSDLLDGQDKVVVVEDGHRDSLVLSRKLDLSPGLILDLKALARASSFFPTWSKPDADRSIDNELLRFNIDRNFSTLTVLPIPTQEQKSELAKKALALRWLVKKFADDLPEREYRIIDSINRIYSSPNILIDFDALKLDRDELTERHNYLLDEAFRTLPSSAAEVDRADLASTISSDAKLFKLLEKMGANPPKGVSFAKTSSWVRAKLQAGTLPVKNILSSRLEIMADRNDLSNVDKILTLRGGEDFTLPVALKFCGAVTTRIQSDSADRINFLGISRRSPIRRNVKPKPGDLLFSADFTGVELRIAYVLSGALQELEQIRKGIDPYKREASSLFSVPYDSVDSDQRATAKEICLSGIFGASGASMRESLYDNKEILLDPEVSDALCKAFRKRNLLIVNCWDEAEHFLDRLASGIDCDGEQLFNGAARWASNRESFIVPSGLAIHLPSIKRSGAKGFVYGPSGESIYGVKLFQYIVQSIGRALLTQPWLELLDNDVQVTLPVHDQLYWTSPVERFAEILSLSKRAMTKSPEWLPLLPLNAEIEVGYNMLDLFDADTFDPAHHEKPNYNFCIATRKGHYDPPTSKGVCP